MALYEIAALVPLGGMNRPKGSSSSNDSDFEGKSLKTLP
jgi:hypothetical protein